MTKIYYSLYAFLSIIIFNNKLKKNGLTGMFKIYAANYESIPSIDYSTYSEPKILKIDKALNTWINTCVMICSFLPFEAKCIHQSFFLYKVIRKKYGIPLSLVVGTCPFPFSAHAWLMIDDKNFFEAEYETSKYHVMLRSESFYEMG